MIELLAPAGSMEALKAAVESGADAIYLSGKMFGARAYANNFDEQGLKEAIEFAHLRNVKIHVTVNTLVDNSEIPALADYFRFLYEIGADAIQEAAKIVDENIRLMTKQNQYLPPDRVAVLTALQIAEQLIRLKKDYNEFWDILNENRSNKHK